ncbi:MAG: histidine triad nucleotide-binding protein [Oscillospiraceae bacterium]|jgi:histidine triad (HIT) family protein|nr:histidine triad nucleotide-binding protein [Oscillospiraceae bacterium]
MDCIFCKISKKEIKSEIIFEDDLTICFKDLNPVAPIHFLIIPKIHIASTSEINEKNSDVLARIFGNISKIALKFCHNGYRVVSNTGVNAGQSVMHMHFHILAGRELDWPPG